MIQSKVSTFNQIFDKVSKEIPYDKAMQLNQPSSHGWHGLLHSPAHFGQLAVGEVGKVKHPLGRHCLLLRSQHGYLVIYQQQPDRDIVALRSLDPMIESCFTDHQLLREKTMLKLFNTKLVNIDLHHADRYIGPEHSMNWDRGEGLGPQQSNLDL